MRIDDMSAFNPGHVDTETKEQSNDEPLSSHPTGNRDTIDKSAIPEEKNIDTEFGVDEYAQATSSTSGGSITDGEAPENEYIHFDTFVAGGSVEEMAALGIKVTQNPKKDEDLEVELVTYTKETEEPQAPVEEPVEKDFIPSQAPVQNELTNQWNGLKGRMYDMSLLEGDIYSRQPQDQPATTVETNYKIPENETPDNAVDEIVNPSWGTIAQEWEATIVADPKTFVYQDFHNLEIPTTNPHYELSEGLDTAIHHRIQNIDVADQQKLEREIIRNMNTLGFECEQLANLTPKEAIWLSVQVAANSLEYFDVDFNPDFIQQHGRFLPIEEYMAIGKGDCDKYRDITIATFDYIKQFNSSLANVYVVKENLIALKQPHAWNTVVIVQEDQVLLSHIDPTFYDTQGNGHLEGIAGYHYPKKEMELSAIFLQKMEQWEASSRLIEQMLPNTTGNLDNQRLLALLQENYFNQNNLDGLQDIITMYKNIFSAAQLRKMDAFRKCYFYAALRARSTFRNEQLANQIILDGQEYFSDLQ